LIMMGAIPSALLAVAMELIFEGVEVMLIPRHLRQRII
jgi:osmoprotectant transport system permease protein